MTFNVHGCIGRGGKYDQGLVMQVIEESDADFVALQEVYDEDPEDRRFLSSLENSSYSEMVYGITLTHEMRGPYGNVFLSRWPLSEVKRLNISIEPYEPRGAIRVKAKLGQRCIDLTATHLGLRKKERAMQLSKLIDEWKLGERESSEDEIFCFMGDLNEWLPGGGILRQLSRQFGRSPFIRTFPSGRPAFALDRIFVRPRQLALRWFAARTQAARRASDHLPLLADLKL